MATSMALLAAAISPENEWLESDCRTPTAAEFRISEPTTCPPAPRKLRNNSNGESYRCRPAAPAAAAESKLFFAKTVDLEKIFETYRVG